MNRWLTLVVLIAISFAAVFFALNEAHRNRVLTTDSIVYVDTARHIADGKGIRTSILKLNGTEAEPPQTQYPPFYSMLIAGAIKLGVEPIFAGRLISAICFGILVFFVGLWLWRKLNPLTGIAAAAVLTTLPALTGAAAAVWADLLYTLIVLIIAGLGVALLNKPSRRGWFILGSLVGIAIFTKYLGIILIGVATVFLLLEFVKKKMFKQSITHTLAVISGIALFTMPLLLRNVLLNRPVGGTQRYASNQPLAVILHDTWATLSKDLTANWLWVVIVILSLASILVIRYSRSTKNELRIREFPVQTLLLIIATYIIGLIATRWLIDTDPIHTRFLVPIYPLIIITFMLIIHNASVRFGTKFYTITLGLIAMISIGWTIKTYDFRVGPYSIGENSRLRWVRENTTNHDLLIGDHAPEYTLALGRTSVYLSGNPHSEKLTSDRVRELTEQWKSRFNRELLTLTPNLDPQEYGTLVAELSKASARESRLTLIHQEPKLLVYQLSRD